MRCFATWWRILVGALREVDSVGRIGGEEFLVIARETNEEGAHILADAYARRSSGRLSRIKGILFQLRSA